MSNIFQDISEDISKLFETAGDNFSDFATDVADALKLDIWVIRENKTLKNLENCNGVATADETTRTCVKCVALNKTIFHFLKYPTYGHPYCKCKQKLQGKPKVILDFPESKITQYLFSNENKRKMMHTMGYTIEHFKMLYNTISAKVKEGFYKVDYRLKNLDECGQRFAINIILDGVDGCIGKKYRCQVGCIAYPFGKIRVVTPIMKKGEIKQ